MKALYDIYGCREYPLVYLKSIAEDNIALIVDANDLSPSMVDNGTSTISFTITDSVENPQIHYYDDIVLKNRIFVEELNMMFVINECSEDIEGDMKTKTVGGISLEAEDFNETITIQKGLYQFWDVLKPNDSLMGKILKQIPEWAVGEIDTELAILNYRFDDINENAYNFMMNTVEDAYECVFRFDSVAKKIYAYTNENSGKNKGAVLRMTDVIQKTTKSSDNGKFVTCMEVMGGNGLSISTVNPIGTNRLYDYSGVYHMMEETFRNKVISWQSKIDNSQQAYANLLTQLNNKNAEMQVLKTQLVEIETNKNVQHEIMALHIKNGTTSSAEYVEAQRKYNQYETSELNKKRDIQSKQTEIDGVMAQLKPINESLQPINNFTPQEMVLLSRFTYSTQYIDEKYTQTSEMSNKEIQDMAQKLYDKSKKKLAKHSGELVAIDIELSNIMLDEEYADFVNNMELGDDITVEVGNDKFVTARLLVCEWNYDDPTSMTIQIADGLKAVGDKYEVAEKVIKKQAMDNSIKVDMGGWTEASGNNSFLNNLQKEGLNANLQAIKSNENAEFRVDGTGALMRKYVPETNTYSPEQLWLIHNQICITNDAFETIKLAIGRLLMADGSTWGYGVSSELLIGKIIMGQKCIIQSEDTMVTIDGDGIKVENGHIFIKDKNGQAYIDGEKISLGGTVGLSTNKSLPTGSNVMIFAGANTYELRDKALFRVYDDGRVVMQNADVTGDITAKSLNLEGDLITPDGGICNEGSGDNPLFWGGTTHANRHNANFQVGHNGNLKAKQATIDGVVKCTELYLGNDKLSNVLTANNKIDSKYIDNLKVDSLSANAIMANNAWIKNVLIEELQTNFDDWIVGQYQTPATEVNYIYVHNEAMQMITRNVVLNEFEYLKLNDKFVYNLFIIGEENNRWFTLTDMKSRAMQFVPKVAYEFGDIVTNGLEYKVISIHNMPDTIETWEQVDISMSLSVTDDSFKVKVKKTVGLPMVKWEQKFKNIPLTDGTSTVTPIQEWGVGTASGSDRGKGFIYKDQVGLVLGGYNENNDGITALRVNTKDCINEYYDMNKKDFVPLVNNWVGGNGNVIFHADKTELTQTDITGTNALHVGYSKTGNNIVGANSTLFTSGLSLLGVELATSLPPIITEPVYLYRLGNEYSHITGGWKYTSDNFHYNQPDYCSHEPTKVNSIYFYATSPHEGRLKCASKINTVNAINLRGATKLRAKVNVINPTDMNYKWTIVTIAREGDKNNMVGEAHLPQEMGLQTIEIPIDEANRQSNVHISVIASATNYGLTAEFELLELWLEGSQPPPSKTYLYNNGNENVSITGGWGHTDKFVWGAPKSPCDHTAEKLSNKMNFWGSYGHNGGSHCSSNINTMTAINTQDYSSICAKVNIINPVEHGSYIIMNIAYENNPNVENHALNMEGQSQTYKMPIKTEYKNSKVYVSIYCTSTYPNTEVHFELLEVWLE